MLYQTSLKDDIRVGKASGIGNTLYPGLVLDIILCSEIYDLNRNSRGRNRAQSLLIL